MPEARHCGDTRRLSGQRLPWTLPARRGPEPTRRWAQAGAAALTAPGPSERRSLSRHTAATTTTTARRCPRRATDSATRPGRRDGAAEAPQRQLHGAAAAAQRRPGPWAL